MRLDDLLLEVRGELDGHLIRERIAVVKFDVTVQLVLRSEICNFDLQMVLVADVVWHGLVV